MSNQKPIFKRCNFPNCGKPASHPFKFQENKDAPIKDIFLCDEHAELKSMKQTINKQQNMINFLFNEVKLIKQQMQKSNDENKWETRVKNNVPIDLKVTKDIQNIANILDKKCSKCKKWKFSEEKKLFYCNDPEDPDICISNGFKNFM